MQLFDARDPAPFIERDLDDDFVEYVVSYAEEFSISAPLKIVIFVKERDDKFNEESTRSAIRNFFEYKADLLSRQMRSNLRTAQFFLFMGLVVLFVSLFLAQLAESSTERIFHSAIREGLVIWGWVAMWKPIQTLLYEWYPHWQKRRLFRKLASVDIDFR